MNNELIICYELISLFMNVQINTILQLNIISAVKCFTK